MIWHLIAATLSRPAVAAWLIKRAQRTPYFHLDGYMERWWVVPYRAVVKRSFWTGECTETERAEYTDSTGPVSPWRHPFAWLLQRFDIAIRVHHILRADDARDPHDHPWNARTIVLRGWYEEVREGQALMRAAGDTATLQFGEFHHIREVSPGGVWTLFITGRKRGTWGFRKADDTKVPYWEYLK